MAAAAAGGISKSRSRWWGWMVWGRKQHPLVKKKNMTMNMRTDVPSPSVSEGKVNSSRSLLNSTHRYYFHVAVILAGDCHLVNYAAIRTQYQYLNI